MPAPRVGKFADLDSAVASGALLPVVRPYTFGTVAASATVKQKVKPRAAGQISKVSAYVNALGGAASLTVEVYVRGALAALAQALTADVVREIEGFGTDTTGETRSFNANTAANKRLLQYEAGEEIEIRIIAGAGGAPSNVNVELTCDERQPRT